MPNPVEYEKRSISSRPDLSQLFERDSSMQMCPASHGKGPYTMSQSSLQNKGTNFTLFLSYPWLTGSLLAYRFPAGPSTDHIKLLFFLIYKFFYFYNKGGNTYIILRYFLTVV